MRLPWPSCPAACRSLPKNVGQGRVHIGGNANTTLDTSATAIDQTGKPGTVDATAIPIVIIPGVGEVVAQATAAAITTAVTQGKLVGITAEAFGSDLFLDGMASITGLTVTTLNSIHDLAGNDLRPNRPDGTTRFSILTGLGTDYGDAPTVYPVLREDNGAGHQIVAGYYLGNFVDAESDGQPSALADADLSDDGVLFAPMTAGKDTTMDVTASAAGFLDVWLDANGDGDWNDSGEKIFSSKAVIAGSNGLTFKVVATAIGVPTFMRFRFSSTGGLSPTGIAADGEVEDYVVTIAPNPWQNSGKPRDVNGDTFISPLDALLIINLLNFNPGISLTPLPVPPLPGFAPPPYYDVNGDGYVSPIDALMVINYLNGEGEGEGEAQGYGLAAAGSQSPLVDSGLDIGLGLLSGQVLVTPDTSTDAHVVTSPAVRVATVVDTPSLLPETGYPDRRVSATELAGRLGLTDLQVDDLEDLLEDIAGETGDLASAEEAHAAIFAQFGV